MYCYSPPSSRIAGLLHVILHEWLAFYGAFWTAIRVVYLQRCSAVTGLVPSETAAVTVRSVYTTQARIMSRHFTQSHIRRVYACLAVTCHLRFRQNDRDLLRATAVTRGWNGHQHKSQHRKLTLEKNSLPLLLPELEPATFQPRGRCCNDSAILVPRAVMMGTMMTMMPQTLLIALSWQLQFDYVTVP